MARVTTWGCLWAWAVLERLYSMYSRHKVVCEEEENYIPVRLVCKISLSIYTVTLMSHKS